MQRALALALEAEGNTSPNPMVGCVIVDDEGSIVGEGYHHKAGEPHAEVNALAEAKHLARGATAYVTLEPCCMCAGAIVQSRLDRVVFGAYDAQAGACGSLYRITEDPAMNHFTRADGGLMEEECAALIRQSLRK